MDKFKHFKKPKIKVFNEKGVQIRRCPRCRSTRLKRTIDKGFECNKCGFLNKRRMDRPENLGKISFKTYS